MTKEPNVESNGDAPAEARIRRRRSISIVWIVPILAAVAAGGLWIQALRARGPLVTVTFDDGSGLEAGKTQVEFQGVSVGKVESVTLSDDLETVVTTIRLDASAARMAREGAEYWVVRPTFGIGGVSGLQTLVSGSYIAVVPGEGPAQKKFVGVAEPGISTIRIPGLKVELRAAELGSLSVGSPVAFRRIQVGEVTGFALRSDRSGVDLSVVIYDHYRRLARKGSRFWNASGIDITLGAGGLEVKSQSLAALLLGGISFETPDGAAGGGEVASGAKFKLYEDHAAIQREITLSEGLNIILVAGSLGSVKTGDPVFYREVRVGEVVDEGLARDSRNVRLSVNIWPSYAPLVRTNSRFWNASGLKAHFGLFSGLDVSVESLESLVAGGIAFATPDSPGRRAGSGSVFTLADKPDDDWLGWAPRIERALGSIVKAPASLVRKGAQALGSKDQEAAAVSEPESKPESTSRKREEATPARRRPSHLLGGRRMR